MWGLAAYGDDGVQTVVEMLQSDLARIMAACGNLNPASIARTQVKIHAQRAASMGAKARALP
jgi:isopentenyl diphosphate isomerase/L-lactate dehydrogenase-like FMN-dependent dehydrogenase